MSKYEIIDQITESTLISSVDQLKKYDAREIADLIFLYFVALQILKSTFESAPFAIDYANHTRAGSFDIFPRTGTDLNILIHTLFGKNNIFTKNMLKNQKASDVLISKLRFNVSKAKSWLSNVRKVNENSDNRFLLKIESDLQISVSNYKSVRRLATEWNSIDHSARQLAMTRLLQAFRAKAPRSELLPALEKVSKQKNLFLKGAGNPEKSGGSGSFLKKLGIGAAVATGIGAYLLYKAAKGVNKERK